jgi:hypothetical protein
MNNFLA